MKRLLLFVLVLAFGGCAAKPTTAPTPPVATGYTSPADQQLGEALAAVNAFARQESANYATLSPAQQGAEKAALNALIAAVNAANASYTAFHGGQGTLAQAQAALTSAQTAQTNLANAKGVK